nr:DNA repair protein rev1 isoform X2 [Megalopta genalis]
MSKKKKGEAWGENGFEDWGGYMAAKAAKLEEQFRNEATKEFKDASNIMEGVSIFVNGYTDPSADELRRLMMAHGGTYHHYMRPKATTHIIASNLPYSKIVLFRKSQNPMPICKPEWIVDSIKAGRLLNFQKYLLYSNCTDMQPQLKFKRIDELMGLNVKVHDSTKKNNDLTILPNDTDNVSNALKSTATNQEVSNPIVAHGSKESNSTKNPEFISEFYSHSRLHHISTMGATFKNYVNELRDKSDGKFPGLDKLKKFRDLKLHQSMSDSQNNFEDDTFDFQEENRTDSNQGSVIMHIDMDCFFVSVGLRNKPELKGLPVAVTHAKGNRQPAGKDIAQDELGSLSEIASCSYEARKAGLKNGMFLGEALKICPNLKTMPYDFDGYTEVSYTLYDTVASYTLNIEAVSCDEMYADCTKILEECSLTPLEFADAIRREIKEKTGCPVSTGFGSNKLLARLATRKAKPDGQFHLKQNIDACIGALDVQDLPGVGWTTTNKLHSMNVRTCAELQTVSSSTLQKEFGKKMGEVLYNMCRGIDHSKLNLEHVRKSVSAEVNYGIRFESNEDAIDFLKKLSVEVSNRLRNINARGRIITLKLMIRAKEASKETAKFMGHGLCDYMTKSKNLIASIDDPDIIAKEVITLWNQMLKVPEDARGIGIQVTKLEISKSKSRDMTLKSFVTKKSNDNGNLRGFVEKSSTSVPPISVPSTSVPLKSFVTKKSNDNGNLRGFVEKSSTSVPPISVPSTSVPLKSFVTKKSNDNGNLRGFVEKSSTSVPPISVPSTSVPLKSFVTKKSNDNGNLRGFVEKSSTSVPPISVPSTSVPLKSFVTKKSNDNGNLRGFVEKSSTSVPPISVPSTSVPLKSFVTKKSNDNGNLRGFVEKSSTSVPPISVPSTSVPSTSVSSTFVPSTSAPSTSKNIIDDQKNVVDSYVDEAVLSELPEDIRKEVMDVQRRERNDGEGPSTGASKTAKKSENHGQTLPGNFFKQIKSGVSRPAKVDLPPLQEVDMAVLIELPEDIRNEILNEYKDKKNGVNAIKEESNDAIGSNTVSSNAVRANRDEGIINFSQVDPEFLAALSDDMKREVENYCTAKKSAQSSKMKKEEPARKFGGGLLTRNENVVKGSKQTDRKTKSSGKNSKATSTKNGKKKGILNAFKAKQTKNKCESIPVQNDGTSTSNGISKCILPRLSEMGSTNDRVTGDEAEAILSHNRTISEDNESSIQHQDILIDLVNRLLNLPLEQVKMQIQIWITNSKIVNEVDFLSLATFLSMLPEKRRIEDLHILLKTMHRCMTKTGNCIWHRTYRKTVKYVQHYMQIEYNSNLMVPPIKCNHLQCNNDI